MSETGSTQYFTGLVSNAIYNSQSVPRTEGEGGGARWYVAPIPLQMILAVHRTGGGG